MKALRVFIFVLVMGTVSGAMLVGISAFTSPLIQKNEEFALKSAILDVLEVDMQCLDFPNCPVERLQLSL